MLFHFQVWRKFVFNKQKNGKQMQKGNFFFYPVSVCGNKKDGWTMNKQKLLWADWYIISYDFMITNEAEQTHFLAAMCN